MVGQVERPSQSRLGDLRPVEHIMVEAGAGSGDIATVTIEYGACPPEVVIDDLIIQGAS